MDDYNFSEDTLTEALTLPSNRDAEEALIGAVLIDQDVFLDVSQFLNTEDFFIVRNQWIWDAFHHINDSRQPIDLVTVTEILTNRVRLRK